ncbi:hypothetical protein BJX96DRAFT_122447 [Aspergillus floccosus]
MGGPFPDIHDTFVLFPFIPYLTHTWLHLHIDLYFLLCILLTEPYPPFFPISLIVCLMFSLIDISLGMGSCSSELVPYCSSLQRLALRSDNDIHAAVYINRIDLSSV